LDLGTIAESFSPALRSALSTPIKEGERLVGVLTVYSTDTQPFGDDHKYLAERVADLLATHLDSLAEQPVRSVRSISERRGTRSAVAGR
jgi:GAF domain-containing protein